MVIMDKYYSIIGKKYEDVNPLWKHTHIFVFTTAFITSSITSYSFGSALSGFGYNCILNANISFEPFRQIQKGNLTYGYPTIDFLNTEWGTNKQCDYCLFSLIIISIFAFVMATFFIINPRGGRGSNEYGLSPPWQIVFPSIIVVGVVFLLLISVSIGLYNGIFTFCEQFQPILNTTKCTESMNVYTLIFNDSMVNEHMYIILTKYSFYVALISWTVQLVLLVSRFLTGSDFNIVIVTVKPKISDGKTDETEMEIEL